MQRGHGNQHSMKIILLIELGREIVYTISINALSPILSTLLNLVVSTHDRYEMLYKEKLRSNFN